ncbi:hypothetical protein [Sphingobacterium suaedae]|uniref:Uncharacterized protein n=1 Tax=Sphingobacterium suaedae TaxID=1686402 RepID=A0ABW5KID6_9SPHI
MDKLIQELEVLVNHQLYVAGLTLALAIPDICAALESEDGKATGAKYKLWAERYLIPNYDGMVTASDFYKLRCASVHQGKLHHHLDNYDKIIFKLPVEENEFMMHRNTIYNTLQLSAKIFINEIVEAYYNWKDNNSNNPNLTKNLRECFTFHANGYPGLVNDGLFMG